MTNHRGILMSAQMIRAYKNGYKRMTRRTHGLDKINVRPDDWTLEELTERGAVFVNKIDTAQSITVKPPYGWVGGFLYFKETWKMFEKEDGRDLLHYRADDEKIYPFWWAEYEWTRPDPVWIGQFDKWRSSMFMPRICARFRDIPITGVRVERVQYISEADAMAEGVTPQDSGVLYPSARSARSKSYRLAFVTLWDELNVKRGHGWERNEWVWVYEFPDQHEMEILYGNGDKEPAGVLKRSDVISKE